MRDLAEFYPRWGRQLLVPGASVEGQVALQSWSAVLGHDASPVAQAAAQASGRYLVGAGLGRLVRPTDWAPDALDAKVVLDDNAEFRHKDWDTWRDPAEETPGARLAREKGLSYVKLDGDIGCIVNGAGLAMATMDLIKHYGGEPANFLDIGGSSNPEKVTAALRIITGDSHVRAILFNIFGGITRCDDVANGIVASLTASPLPVPLVIRLTGTNEERARQILKDFGLGATTSMDEAVRMVIEKAQEVTA